MKKFLAFFLALFFSCSFAQTQPVPTITAKSWLLLDLTSGQVIASNSPHKRAEPLDLAKLMTAYISFNAIRDKKLALDKKINVSERVTKVNGTKMFLSQNNQVSVSDLILGLIVHSGNDAAIALAEEISGSESGFVELMNSEAEHIGMKSTHFTNAHGISDKNQYTTAYDLSLLSTHIIADHPDLYKLFSLKEFTYNNVKQSNPNRLLWTDNSVDGLQATRKDKSEYSLISSAKRKSLLGERRLLTVILGASSEQMRTQETLKLLNYGFQNFDTLKLYPKGSIANLNVWKGSLNQVRIGFKQDLYITIPKGSVSKIRPVLEHKEPIIAPISEGSQLAVLKITIGDKTISEFPVVALENVNSASVFGRTWDSVMLMLKE